MNIIDKKENNIDKKIDVIIISCFLVLLFVPNIIVPLVNWFFNKNFGANSVSDVTPSLTIRNIETFPSDYDEWYENNLPFRDVIGRGWAQLNYFVLGDSANDGVVLGKADGEDSDRWLFYNNEDDFSPVKDAQGSTNFSDEEMDAMATMINKNTEKARQRGAKMYYLVAPSKESIYSEFLPESVERYREKTRMDLFFEYASGLGISNIIYPKAEIMEAKNTGQLYYKQDTHWNELGAGVAFKEMLRTVIPSMKFDYDYGFKGQIVNGDLSKMLKITNYFSDEIVSINYLSGSNSYLLEETNDATTSLAEDNFGEMSDMVVSHNKSAPIKKSILMVGDSFRTKLKEYFYRSFSECVIVHRRFYKPEMMEKYDPDVVILEFAERYAPAISGFKIDDDI